jgi:hypothetical protein
MKDTARVLWAYPVAMAITDRTRKILWVKAGGRCSICRVQLVTEGTDSDDPSVFGEEAHQIARAPTGPRAGKLAGRHSYNNLILLCRKHHKQVDDQASHYTVERLKEIKRKHEEWVASLGDSAHPGPVRLVPDRAYPAPKALQVITTGDALWRLVDGARSFYPAWPDNISDEHQELIDTFLDEVDGWMNVAGDLDSFGARREASRALGEHIKGLAEAGFLVGANERHLLLVGGINEEPWPWRGVDIQVHSAADIQFSDADGNSLRFDEDSAASSRQSDTD